MEPGSAAYDEVADAYHEALDPEGLGLRDPVFQQLLTDVAGAHVLALACGQGRDARLLADLGATVVGVDVSEHMLEYARRFEQTTRRGVRYVRGDAKDLEAFDDERFDGVVAHMALMDIPKLEPTVGSVARVLRPGGWFVFSIVHPCYRPHVEIVADYLVEARYDRVARVDWLPPHSHHRPLGAYVNTLTGAGVSITHMVEPPGEPPSGEVPGLLYLRCVKAATPAGRRTAARSTRDTRPT